MKLVYWVAARLDDSTAYSLRGKRRRDVLEQLAEHNLDAKGGVTDWHAEFGPAHKVVVEYDGAFDLLDQCLGEGGVYEGSEEELAKAQAYDQKFHGVPDDPSGSGYVTFEGISDAGGGPYVPDDPDDEFGPDDEDWYA